MSYRKVLIVHKYIAVRSLLRGFLMSEFNDIQPIEVNNTDDATDLILKQKLDVILCPSEVPSIGGLGLFQVRSASALNQDTPFILFTSTDIADKRASFTEAGIEHVLPTPFTASDLQEKINEVSNPRQYRVHTRYNVEGIVANISLPDGPMEGMVINVSKTSMLLETDCRDRKPEFFQRTPVDLQFPPQYGGVLVREIQGKMLRMHVLEWDENDCPIKIRAVWQFLSLPPDQQELLYSTLKLIHVENTKVSLSM